MMVEIMDKYVQAGEALAEKENDVRQLMKQVRSTDHLIPLALTVISFALKSR